MSVQVTASPKPLWQVDGKLELIAFIEVNGSPGSCLAQLQGRRVLILRGTGGRELLAEVLTARGAAVEYYQPYQRIAINLCGAFLVKQWQQQNINGAIISSVELLERLFAIVPENELSWLKSITIYAPSKRIAEYALLSGCSNVKVLPGMRDQQIIDYFK